VASASLQTVANASLAMEDASARKVIKRSFSFHCLSDEHGAQQRASAKILTRTRRVRPVVAAMLLQTMQYVNALFPPIAWNGWGLRGGVEMGTYWRPTVPNPHASPKVRCAVSEI